MEKQKIEMTAEELSATLEGVRKLHALYTQHPDIFISYARKNGKSLLAYNFTKQYIAIIKAYEKAERKAKKRLGYLPLNALEFSLYIIKCKAKEFITRLRYRLELEADNDE